VPIKAVIFDLDGTLTSFNLDFKALRAEVRGHLLNMGIPASILKVNENIFDMLKKTELFMKNAGKPESAIQQVRMEALTIAEKYELEAAATTNLLPGVNDTLKALKLTGLKIALCTINSQKTTNYILKRFRLTQYFDATIPRENVADVKPHPNHIETALKILEVSPSETIVVGDSVSDIQSAKELNVLGVGLTTGVSTKKQLINAGAHCIIDSITDVPVLIECINKDQEKAEP
jgi:HAD superfamily hydrolase (TIGR01509 family)